MMNNCDSKAKDHYMKYYRILKTVIKEAKNQHYSRLITKYSNKIKTTWTNIRNETGQLRTSELIPSLHVNNEN